MQNKDNSPQREASTSTGAASIIAPAEEIVPAEQKTAMTVSTTQTVSPFLQYGGSYATAIAAVIAASIAAFIALRSMRENRQNLIKQLEVQREIAQRTSRASVISANRQKWIDAIRDDLAELIARDKDLAEIVDIDETGMSQEERERHDQRYQSALVPRAILFQRIKLRLNPDKKSHEKLLNAIRLLMEAKIENHAKLSNNLVSQSQIFLRAEWQRVKREAAGEYEPLVDIPTPKTQNGGLESKARPKNEKEADVASPNNGDQNAPL